MSSTFRSLKYYNARLFFSGLAVSNVGTWLQMTAMSLLVYRLTGEATTVGITLALQMLPTLLLGAWAGVIADGRDRRTMAIVTQSALAAQALVLGTIDLAGWANLPVVYALSLLLGVVNAFDNPARRGLVTELVPTVDIPNATSLNTAVMTGSRIFGPALAGVLVATIGTAWCFILNGVTFFAIIFSLVAIRRDEMFPTARRSKGGKPIREALSFVVGRRDMLIIYSLLVVVSTVAFNQGTVLPKLADVRWGGDEAYGFVLAVMSVGSLTGSLLTARQHVVTMRWFFGGIVVMALAGFGLAWAPNLPLAYVWSVPFGIGGAAFVAGANAITQQECPPDMRSRLLALQAVAFLGSTPIGGPITGLIADHVSAEWALAYSSVISLICVGVAGVYWRAGNRAGTSELSSSQLTGPAPRADSRPT
jgi:MFS family permease